jgi:predicted DNA-binding protein
MRFRSDSQLPRAPAPELGFALPVPYDWSMSPTTRKSAQPRRSAKAAAGKTANAAAKAAAKMVQGKHKAKAKGEASAKGTTKAKGAAKAGAAKPNAKAASKATAQAPQLKRKANATAKTKSAAKLAAPKSRAKTATRKRRAKDRPKTSVYLDAPQLRHLDRIAERTGRAKAELIRAAIESYEPGGEGERDFALAGGFARIDSDPRPISTIPEEELLRGFGA